MWQLCISPGPSYQLVFLSDNVGDVHVVGGRAEFFEFLASEDIDGNEMDLCVTVLSSLGGGHVDDLARTVLDDNETVLPQGRALHGEGGRGASIGGLEGVFMLGRRRVSDRTICAKDDAIESTAWCFSKDSTMRPTDCGACAGWIVTDKEMVSLPGHRPPW